MRTVEAEAKNDPRGGEPFALADLAISIALALATWGVFSQTLGFDFVGADDHRYITQNITVQGGLSTPNTVWAFTTLSESNWHPLTWLSHMLDIELYGINDPGGHHLSGVLFHLLNSILLFAVLRYLTGARWRSALVAGLFALHPLHVESVAWISERKDVLSTFFWLLAMGLYGASAREQTGMQRRHWLGLSVIAMALGLLAKPMLVTLPFVLLLLDYWPLNRFRTQGPAALIREKAPFFVLTALSILVTLSAQSGGGAMRSSESVGLGLRVGNAMVSYVRYLGKAIWPTDLAILYPHPNIPGGGGIPWLGWEIAASASVLALLTGLVCFWGRHYKYLVVGWLGFLGTLIPVIGIVQVGTQAMADRYTYVPLIWVFLAVSWGAGEVVTVLQRRLPVIRFLATALAILWLFALATLARQQTSHWRDSVALFQHALSVSPDSSVLHLAYSTALARQGRLQESIVHSKRALQIRPDYPEAHSDLGSRLSDLGRHKPALKHHKKALALSPGAAEAYYNYANALARSGDLGGARRAYQQAIRRNPSFAPAHHNLALLIRDEGGTEDAIAHFHAALDANPYLSGTRYQLALALAQQGRTQEAAKHFQTVLEQDPHNQLAREQWEALERPEPATTHPDPERR